MNMPLNAAAAMYILYAAYSARRYMHVLQLKSYSSAEFFSWFRQNFVRETGVNGLLPILSVALLYYGFDKIFYASWIFAYFILLYSSAMRKPPEGEKFKTDGRIKRLYVTLGILMAIVLAGVNLTALKLDARSSAVLFLALAFIGEVKITYVYIANAINHPIEKMTNM